MDVLEVEFVSYDICFYKYPFQLLTMCLLFGNVDTARLSVEGAMMRRLCKESMALLDGENTVRVAIARGYREYGVWNVLCYCCSIALVSSEHQAREVLGTKWW